MIQDPTQIILNATVAEILEEPTEEEIKSAVSYFEDNGDPQKAFDKYLKPLVKKHDVEWVNALAYAVCNNLLSKESEG